MRQLGGWESEVEDPARGQSPGEPGGSIAAPLVGESITGLGGVDRAGWVAGVPAQRDGAVW